MEHINAKRQFNVHDIYKFIAIFLMFIDHIGMYILNGNVWFRCVGRLSYPIFAFIYGEHFNKNNSNLLFNGLCLFAFDLFLKNEIRFNILVCFFISGLLVKIYNKLKVTKFLFVEILTVLHFFIYQYFEYGVFTFLFMITTLKNKKWLLVVFALYLMEEIYIFKFNGKQILLLLTLSVCEIHCFFIYKNNKIKENKITKYIKTISRNSMEVYFIQYVLFKLLSLKLTL
ncbi:MAG: conjugal transfer protein TraX [Rickettsiales bacterium]|jgi:hypothetical protein|nr:conjugal transfer protein TraX [Rickettsiales bacterium]